MTLIADVDDYRYELIKEASDFRVLYDSLLQNPLANLTRKASDELSILFECRQLLQHPEYVLLEMGINLFECPFDLTKELIEICPENAISVMSGLALPKDSKWVEQTTHYFEYLQAEETRHRMSGSQLQYASSLKSEIVQMYNIRLSSLTYIFFGLLVGYVLGLISFIIESCIR